jgi:hypothetical protein
MHDCARALQFIRSQARAYKIDATRVGEFGFALKEKADRLGVECTVLLREDHPDGYPIDKFVDFLSEKLLAK